MPILIGIQLPHFFNLKLDMQMFKPAGILMKPEPVELIKVMTRARDEI